MALPLKKEDIVRGGVTPQSSSNAGFDFSNIVKGVNSVLQQFNNTMNTGKQLFDNYKGLAEKLKPQQPQQQPEQQIRGNPMEEHEKAEHPRTRKNPPLQVVEEAPQDKQAKAEQIFKEIHEAVKPYMPFLKGVSGIELLQMALKPENKKKIVETIASKI